MTTQAKGVEHGFTGVRPSRRDRRHRHDRCQPGDVGVAVALSPEASGDREAEETPAEIAHLVIVPPMTLNRAAVRALAFAAALQQPVIAVHVAPTEEQGDRFRQYRSGWGRFTCRSSWSFSVPGDRAPVDRLYRVAPCPAVRADRERRHARADGAPLVAVIIARRHGVAATPGTETAPEDHRDERSVPR